MINKLDHPIATDSECRIINKMLDMECRIDHKIDTRMARLQETLWVSAVFLILCMTGFGFFTLLNLKNLIRLMEG